MRFLLFIVCSLLVHYEHPWPAFAVLSICWLCDWAKLESTRELLELEQKPRTKLREFSRN